MVLRLGDRISAQCFFQIYTKIDYISGFFWDTNANVCMAIMWSRFQVKNDLKTFKLLNEIKLDWTPLKTNTFSREAPIHPDTGFSAQRHENWTENEPNISSVLFALIVENSIDSPAGILDFCLSLCGIKVLVIGLYSPHFQVNGHFVMVACTFPIQSEIQSVIWIYICSNFININIFVPKIKILYFQ